MTKIPTVMSIAGSDSGGGAGIQADIKTIAANGAYGTTVITAVTAQNTRGVIDVQEMSIELVESQINAIMADIGADAVKTGMLYSAEMILCVSKKIQEYSISKFVLDPVMVATSGDSLLEEDAVESIKRLLIPLCSIVTPNGPEAKELTGINVRDLDSARDAAIELVNMGAGAAVVKGGHLDGPATDVLYDGDEVRLFTTKRIDSPNTHGTGCTFASAIACGLALNKSLRDSVSVAKTYVTGGIRNGLNLGDGHGPLNHFHK
jgi:hydroxymethylpyrimidine/phosphomethylpyrimidine kinase